MYRHEIKYSINPATVYLIKSRLQTLCKLDMNALEDGGYRVTSLYFDDYCNSAVKDNLNGQLRRKKFRIRVYNGNDSFIRLERKLKNGDGGRKDSTLLSREQYDMIIKGDYDFINDIDNEVLTDLHMYVKTRLLVPKVIVDYKRVAYIYDTGEVRITFDSDIKSSTGNIDLFDPNNIYAPLGKENETIMEVKYTGFLPSHIKSMIKTNDINREAFSKYVNCRLFIS